MIQKQLPKPSWLKSYPYTSGQYSWHQIVVQNIKTQIYYSVCSFAQCSQNINIIILLINLCYSESVFSVTVVMEVVYSNFDSKQFAHINLLLHGKQVDVF